MVVGGRDGAKSRTYLLPSLPTYRPAPHVHPLRTIERSNATAPAAAAAAAATATAAAAAAGTTTTTITTNAITTTAAAAAAATITTVTATATATTTHEQQPRANLPPAVDRLLAVFGHAGHAGRLARPLRVRLHRGDANAPR